MKALFKTACGCSKMVDVSVTLPEIQLPILVVDLYSSITSMEDSVGYRKGRTRKFIRNGTYGELFGEPIILYEEALDTI